MNKYSSTFVRENNAANWASTLPDSTFRQLVDGDCGGRGGVEYVFDYMLLGGG